MKSSQKLTITVPDIVISNFAAITQGEARVPAEIFFLYTGNSPTK